MFAVRAANVASEGDLERVNELWLLEQGLLGLLRSGGLQNSTKVRIG